MQRTRIARPVLTLSFALLGLVGCGEDKSTGTIQMSPEAKKADESAQKGMQEFMKTKGQSRPSGKAY